MNKWATGWQRTFMLSSGSIVRFTYGRTDSLAGTLMLGLA